MPGQCSAVKQNVNNFSPLHNMTVKARIWLLLNVSSLMTNEMFHTWSSSGIQSTIRFFLSVWSLVLTDYIYYWKLSDSQCTDHVFEQWVFSYVKWDWFSAWRFSNIWGLITMLVGKSLTAGQRLSDRHRRFNLGLQYYNDSGRSLNPPGNLTGSGSSSAIRKGFIMPKRQRFLRSGLWWHFQTAVPLPAHLHITVPATRCRDV